MFQRKLQYAWLASTLLLGACMGPGEPIDIPLTLPAPHFASRSVANQSAEAAAQPQQQPQPTHLIIHTHNQQWPSWMIATDRLALDYVLNIDIAPDNYREAVDAAEKACRLYVHAERPNDLVAVLINGTVYGLAEAPFAMLGASAFKGAKLLQYAQYGGSAEMGGGVGNGIIMIGGKMYDFQNCGRGVFDQAKLWPITVIQKTPW